MEELFERLAASLRQVTGYIYPNEIGVLKADLNTEPKVLYAKLDGEVR